MNETAPPSPTPQATPDGKKVSQKVRVIDSVWTFLGATAVLGPLALPLLWRNPRFKLSTKIAGSIAVLLFTYYLIKWAGNFLDRLTKQLLEQITTP